MDGCAESSGFSSHHSSIERVQHALSKDFAALLLKLLGRHKLTNVSDKVKSYSRPLAYQWRRKDSSLVPQTEMKDATHCIFFHKNIL